MKTLKLILAAPLACASLVPSAVINGHTSTTILNGETITFDAYSSHDNDENGSYINGRWWYVDGVYKLYSSTYTYTFNLPEGVAEKNYFNRKLSLKKLNYLSNGF